jgi:hypothetical protein
VHERGPAWSGILPAHLLIGNAVHRNRLRPSSFGGSASMVLGHARQVCDRSWSASVGPIPRSDHQMQPDEDYEARLSRPRIRCPPDTQQLSYIETSEQAGRGLPVMLQDSFDGTPATSFARSSGCAPSASATPKKTRGMPNQGDSGHITAAPATAIVAPTPTIPHSRFDIGEHHKSFYFMYISML